MEQNKVDDDDNKAATHVNQEKMENKPTGDSGINDNEPDDNTAKWTMEDALKATGAFGPFQWMLIVFHMLALLPGGFQTLSIVHTGAAPEFTCVNDRLRNLNLTGNELKQYTSPIKKGKTQEYDNCRQFKYSSNVNLTTDYLKTAPRNITENCRKWAYSSEHYKETMATKYDLVCSKVWVIPTSKSIYMAGLAVGVSLMGWGSDKFGRKVTTIICNLGVLTFGLLTSLSNSVEMFMVLRFVVALFVMGSYTNIYVLLMEFVGKKYRTPAAFIGSYWWSASFMFIGLLGYLIKTWWQVQLVGSLLGIPTLIYIFLLPESARWLYSQRKDEQGNAQLRRTARYNRKTLPDKFNVHVHSDPGANLTQLVQTPTLRNRTLTMYFCWFTVSALYYGLSLNTGKLGGNPFINFVISGAVEFPAKLAAPLMVMTPLGRRWSFVLCYLLAGVSLLLTLATKEHQTTVTVLTMVGKAGCTAAFDIAYLMTSEVFPTVLRNVAMGTSSMWARIGAITAPYINLLGDISWDPLPSVVFGSLGIAAGLLATLLPETLLRDLPESVVDGENFRHEGRFLRSASNATILKPRKSAVYTLEGDFKDLSRKASAVTVLTMVSYDETVQDDTNRF